MSGVEGGKVSVTIGKKKASVCKETVAVSATRPKIVRKNQNTLPPHLLSQPHHEVEVCRGRDVSEAKVTMGPFFDKGTDITIRAKSITCSLFCSEQLISDYSHSRGGGFELFFQLKLQLQAGSLHGIIFQFRSQPRSRYGERP